MNPESDIGKAWEEWQRAMVDGQREADRLDYLAWRASVMREHRHTCKVCIGGGDCAGPFGDYGIIRVIDEHTIKQV